MRVKKYQARTIDEATAKVRADLGPDAMIFSTKKIEGGNGHNRFEISAVPPGEGPSPGRDSTIDDVRAELISIKEMIYILNHSSGMVDTMMKDQAMLGLYATLIRNGIDSRYVNDLLKKGCAHRNPSAGYPSSIRSETIRAIMQILKVNDPFASGTRRTIAALVGTTGVGKTTTIAKLAAHLMFTLKRTVGLISIDNYRIGALDQLKTYANILGIPCFPAFNRKDLIHALGRLEGKDVVLIDTAGQGQYDMARISELNETMTDDLGIGTHLLLSVATDQAAMHQTAINFSPLKFQSYIFTKIDEAETCGAIINQVMALNCPISFLTNGQNVPEDIEVADKQRIIKLLIKPNKGRT